MPVSADVWPDQPEFPFGPVAYRRPPSSGMAGPIPYMEAEMKLFVENRPAALWQPLLLISLIVAICIALDSALQQFVVHTWIHTFWVMLICCIACAVIVIWYLFAAPMRELLDTPFGEDEIRRAVRRQHSSPDAKNAMDSVRLNGEPPSLSREEIERVVEHIQRDIEDGRFAPLFNVPRTSGIEFNLTGNGHYGGGSSGPGEASGVARNV